jgi:N-acyl-D-amino-acid deacylase
MHDLLITGATLYDGTGAPGRTADLAVSGGRIAAIGRNLGAAKEVMRADGLALAPGIIDVHTHYDAQVTWDPLVSPSPSLGVTTVVIGNCGFTIAPCKPEDRELVMRNLTHVEGMSLDVLRAGTRWEFESFPEYLAMLDRLGVGVNLAAFVGHSSVRTFVMGEDAPRRTANSDEIAAMRRIVLHALEAGAIGFATSTSQSHNGEGGLPMPSRLADETELGALVGTLGDAKRGVFMLTKGRQTSIPFLDSLAAATGQPVIVAALLHNSTAPEAVFEELAQINSGRAAGRRIFGQVSCCPLTIDFTMRSAYPLECLAAYKPAMAAHGDGLKRVLTDTDFRAAVRAEIETPQKVRLFNGEWHKLNVAEVADKGHAAAEGMSVAEQAAAAGKYPLDWMLDLALSENLDTVFTAHLLNSDEVHVRRLLRDRDTIIALSDAGAHLTFFCDAGFGLHLLGHWVRERDVFPLAEAIRRLTAQPAQIYGIRDRGQLAPGLAADLFLFDPMRVGRGPRYRAFDLPGGAPRILTPPLGVEGVWVNGSLVADAKGPRPDSVRTGRVLRDFAS